MSSERVNEVTESGLFFVAEVRETTAKRSNLERIMGGLEAADAIELERARSRVGRAKTELREACEDLDRIEEISAQKSEIRAEMLQLDVVDTLAADEAERAIATNGSAAGFAYVHPDLAAKGAVKGLVKRRRLLHPAEPEAPVSITEVEGV